MNPVSSLGVFAAAFVLLAVVMVPSADAGTYDVVACDAAPSNANNSWTLETNDRAHIAESTTCPSSSDFSGLLGDDKLNTAGVGAGGYAHWVVRAPVGTMINRVRLRRFLYVDGGSGWAVYGRTADGATLPGETCTVQPGQDDCAVGGYASPTIDRTVDTTSVAYGFECAPTLGSQCTTGATIHAAAAAIYAARVTISDPTPPSIGGLSGTLVGVGGYHRGSEAVSFNGSDALGLSARRLYVDGVQRAAGALGCDFTQLVPCSNPGSDASFVFDTGVVGDGLHSVQAAVVDAAGNETRSSPASIVVDNTAPDVPESLGAAPRGQDDPGFSVSWMEPDGQVAPVAAARWTLCPPGPGAGCQSGSVAGQSLSGSLPAEGDWTLSVALEDAAGNVGAPSSVAMRFARPAAPPPPEPTPTPAPSPTPGPTPTSTPPRADAHLTIGSATLKRSSRTVSVSGRIAAAATGEVSVKLSYRVGRVNRTRTLHAGIRGGRFAVRARLSKTDARRATKPTASVSYAGDARYAAAAAAGRRPVTIRR